MKKEHTNFIIGLLTNSRLTTHQRDRVVELALRDLSKNGSEERILQDLDLIKENLGIKVSLPKEISSGGNSSKKGPWSDIAADINLGEDNSKNFSLNGNYWTTPVKEKDIIKFPGDNQENDDYERTKDKNEESSTIVKTMSIEEIQKKLEKLMDPELVLKDKIPKNKNNPNPKNISANPKHVADFMSLFNQREGLKYLTHDFDENKDFEIDKFLISANQVFADKTKNLNIPQSLWRIVQQFAFDSKQTEWTSISADYKKSVPVSIGWATKELRDWSKQNSLHPIQNKEYNRIIDDFKRITRIEPSNFEKLIEITLEGIFKKDIVGFDIQKTDLAKADFYSHVGFLKIALETIFEEIKKRSDSPNKKKISLKYERSISNEGYYLRKISITHHNSFLTKELKLILKEWQEKGNMGKIKEKLEGYCHWSVETLIEENPVRINILKEKEKDEYDKTKEVPEGFTHILTFYYK